MRTPAFGCTSARPAPFPSFVHHDSRTHDCVIINCSFCEQPLTCKNSRRPFKPRSADPHLTVFQPDMHLLCPECHTVLTCQACGYVYGTVEDEEPTPEA